MPPVLGLGYLGLAGLLLGARPQHRIHGPSKKPTTPHDFQGTPACGSWLWLALADLGCPVTAPGGLNRSGHGPSL
eukprot:6167804-Alexandrium_andersonii.AAC.1